MNHYMNITKLAGSRADFASPSRSILLVLFILVTAATPRLSAQNFGDLLVTPMRVVFEGTDRSQALTLFNVGSDTATYDISIIQYRMNEDGTFTEIVSPDSGQNFADPYIRFYPRSVTLPPREAQLLRVQYRPGPGMQDAEYRSHLYFRSVPRPVAQDDESAGDTTALAVKVSAIYGVSIPVIVRVGELAATVTLGNLALSTAEDSARTPRITAVLERSGSMSTYGDLSITYRPAQGEDISLGVTRGVAVYTPNLQRRISLPIRLPEGVALERGRLLVTYTNHSDLKPSLLAKETLELR